ncbi:hypothetical protein EON63_21610 [archaeon]|nr:MAG: hypothetical protein EON63_21610 [archaeon]
MRNLSGSSKFSVLNLLSQRPLGKSHRLLLSCSSTQAINRKEKVVIVDGAAGGATAASRASCLSNGLDITIVERTPDVSSTNCGLPYYLGQDITDHCRLFLQIP